MLVQSRCTFEADHRSCGYKTFSIRGNNALNCVSEYKWRRRGANISNDFVGDLTFGNKTGKYDMIIPMKNIHFIIKSI
jgi:hypothetical protein